MNSLDTFLSLTAGVADQMKDITFFKFLLPFLTVAGGGTFLYYGYLGVFTKRTSVFSRVMGARFYHEVTGVMAVIVGLIYLAIAIPMIIILAFISYHIWF